MMFRIAPLMCTLAAASPFTDSLAGKVIGKDGDYDVKQLEGKAVYGQTSQIEIKCIVLSLFDLYVCRLVYYSAHWCPPCRGFTPMLADFYNKAKAANKDFEIIFVSSDGEKSDFEEYYASMPWLALKFDEREMKQQLADKHGVRGIPALITVAPDGAVEVNVCRCSFFRLSVNSCVFDCPGC